MALAPRRPLLGVPSSAIKVSSIFACASASMPPRASNISPLTASTALRTPLPKYLVLSPSRSSTASCAPVEAPEGTAARPNEPSSSTTSTSTVGLPRLSSIWRPIISTMAVIGWSGTGGLPRFYRMAAPLVMSPLSCSIWAGMEKPCELVKNAADRYGQKAPAWTHRGAAALARQGATRPRAQSASGHELSRAFHRAGIHHAVQNHRPARFRTSGDRLRTGTLAAGIQIAEALSHQLPRPGRLPRGLHRRHRQTALCAVEAEVAAHRRILVSARRHSDRRVLADRHLAEGRLAAGPGRVALSRKRLGRVAPQLTRADHADGGEHAGAQQ